MQKGEKYRHIFATGLFGGVKTNKVENERPALILHLLGYNMNRTELFEFLDKVLGLTPLVYHKKYKADIDTYATLQRAVETDIARHRLPVAIEGQAYQLALAIEHGTARVTASDIIVGNEAEVHIARVLVGIPAPLACLH